MLVRDAVLSRMSAQGPEGRAGRASLPHHLKPDPVGVRIGMLRRLGASRLFALGDRAGVLRSAQARSGRSFRLDTRQRVIVKARVAPHAGARPGGALAAHVAYLGRHGAGAEGARAEFFDRTHDGVDAAAATGAWSADAHHFRFIVSPEHGDRISDLRSYTREVLGRVAEDLGQPDLDWLATCHFDTDQPHAHVLIRGLRESGRSLRIPRAYIAYGFRGRAQEVAHERLGGLSRLEAERRIWRETQADRYTGFDRRLLGAADADRWVDDGVGASGAWAALTRGRLRHLEALGLAARVGRRYRLDADLETRLRALSARQSLARTLQARRLATGREVRELGAAPLRGSVVARGADEAAGNPAWVIVRDRQGEEFHARLALGQSLPGVNRQVELAPVGAVHVIRAGRALGQGL